MSDPATTRAQLPAEPDGLYRLTLRPRPGTDPVANLRAVFWTCKRHGLDVVELRPVEGKPRRQASAAVRARQQRTKATPYYSFFGNHPPLPDNW